jgi:tRNA modification GTPase
VDLTNDVVGVAHLEHQTQLSICAKHSKGIDLLRQKLSEIAGLSDTGEGVLLARKRHIIALEATLTSVRNALAQLDNSAVELLAQELRQAAQDLGSITGEFSSDDLLGEIFSSFCIGK